MKKILLIEDAPDQQMIVTQLLVGEYEVTIAPTAGAGLKELNAQKFALILLDVTLPDEDGFRFCASLKTDARFQNIPVIFLTGKQDPKDKILGFSVGADDYIVKPFEHSEFKARIAAKIKKGVNRSSADEGFRAGDLRISIDERKALLTEDGVERDIGLTSVEFKLLVYFLRNEDVDKTHQQIIASIWGDDVSEIAESSGGDSSAVEILGMSAKNDVSNYTLDAHIQTLKSKLGSQSKCIIFHPKLGYKYSRVFSR